MSQQDYKKKYETLLKEYNQFAYIVAHDLQGSSQQISAFLDILLRELDITLTDEQKEYVFYINKASEDLRNDLQILLNYSRLSNQSQLQRQEINMNTLVKQALGPYQKESIKFTTLDLPPSHGDPKLVSQLFSHLYSNAVKFTRDVDCPTIETRAEEESGQVWYYIKDSGIGMKPEKIESAFGLFKQLHDPDQYLGDGIGLTFAKKIIDLHDGTIIIQSKPYEGTIIRFTIASNCM